MTTVARSRGMDTTSISVARRRTHRTGGVGIPRLALTPVEGAAALGMGLTSFKKYVQPYVRVVRRSKLRVIPVSELERWAEENAENVLGDSRPDRLSDGRQR